MLETAFTRLVGCTVPIQRAGMGGIADAELAAAVSDAGALGMVSMVMVPPTEVASGLAGALAAGASGVRVGTRFVAAAESPAHPDYVDALVRAGAGDTQVTTAFSVMWPDAPHRVLRSCIDALDAFEGDVVGEMAMGRATAPIPKGAVPTARKDTTGAIGAMPLYAGESVGSVSGRSPARDIVAELAQEAERLLRAWA